MALETFFPLGVSQYIVGGLCIGLAVSLIFVLTGQVAGMSSLFSTSLSWISRLSFFQDRRQTDSRVWRLYLALGLVVGAALSWFVVSGQPPWRTEVPLWQLVLGGFLAGFGARLSNGCTSGHGICGLASLKPVSLLAVLTFMATAFLAANLVPLLGGY
jgi:hypothetical protein